MHTRDHVSTTRSWFPGFFLAECNDELLKSEFFENNMYDSARLFGL